MDDAYKILLVEESPDDADLIQDALDGSAGHGFELERVATVGAALRRLREAPWDVVLLDPGLLAAQESDTLVQALQDDNRTELVFAGLDEESLEAWVSQEEERALPSKKQITGPALVRAINLALERKRTHDELQRLNVALERKIGERTHALQESIAELTNLLAQRQADQARLTQRLAMERQVAAISTRFLHGASGETDAVIQWSLQELGRFTGVDRVYVFRFSDDLATFSNTHEWCAPGVAPFRRKMRDLPVDVVGPAVTDLIAGQVFHVPRVRDLGAEMEALKEELEREKVLSMVCVPMMRQECAIGFLGFDACQREKRWSEEDILLLQLVGEIFSGALMRREMEERLRHSLEEANTFSRQVEAQRQELQTVLDGLPFPVFLIDLETFQVRMANHGAREMGMVPEAHCYEVLWGHDRPCHEKNELCVLSEVIQHGTGARAERVRTTPDGRTTIWDFHASPIRDEAGAIRWVVETAIDITDLKRMEEQEQFHAFQAGVAEMATTLLHNIGNAIMSISHRSTLLQRRSRELEDTGSILSHIGGVARERLERGEETQAVLDQLLVAIEETGEELLRVAREDLAAFATQIGTGVQHIADIIKIHQDSANPRALSVEFGLRQMLEDAIAIQSDVLDKYGIQVALDVPAGMENVHLPRGQLLQLAINLIKNAREAIVEAGQGGAGQGRIHIHVGQVKNGWFEVRVADNGCGISGENLGQIFRYGFSTKERSTGFGLHSAATFIQSLHGEIEVLSGGKNRGAEFVLRLPINYQGERHG